MSHSTIVKALSFPAPERRPGRSTPPATMVLFRALATALCALCLASCQPAAARFNDGFCSVGSEELNTILDHWFAAYREQAAAGNASTDTIQSALHEGRGSTTAPGALRDGICDLAPMSRPMNSAEIDSIKEKLGGEPVAIPVAVEALAIIVPAHSKVRELTSEQVLIIFAETPHALEDLFPYIAETEHQGRELDAFGVNSASDRYRWFRRAALDGAQISDRVVEVAGPLQLVDRVGTSRHAFGYARLAELTDRVRALPVDGVHLDTKSAIYGQYPFTRYHYIYLPPTGSENRPHPEAVKFLRFALEGNQQGMLAHLGLFGLNAEDRAKARALLAAYN